MSIYLLLDEEDYLAAIEDLEKFAANNGIECDGSSKKYIEIAATVIMAVELGPAELVMLTKLIYNIGYRDNKFSGSVVH